jgi:chemotaxis response regulator CheB
MASAILPGHAYIAPGGLHLSAWNARARTTSPAWQDGEPVNRHKPFGRGALRELQRAWWAPMRWA